MNSIVRVDSVLRRSEDVVSTQLDQEVAMMSVERGHYYGLNDIGADIWEYLAEPRSTRDLCTYLVTRYAVDSELCEKDVGEFLEEMISEKLVEIQ